MAWEFAKPGGAYTGRLLIDGTIYTTSEATKKFLRQRRRPRVRVSLLTAIEALL
jgi:hypothetical protein